MLKSVLSYWRRICPLGQGLGLWGAMDSVDQAGLEAVVTIKALWLLFVPSDTVRSACHTPIMVGTIKQFQ